MFLKFTSYFQFLWFRETSYRVLVGFDNFSGVCIHIILVKWIYLNILRFQCSIYSNVWLESHYVPWVSFSQVSLQIVFTCTGEEKNIFIFFNWKIFYFKTSFEKSKNSFIVDLNSGKMKWWNKLVFKTTLASLRCSFWEMRKMRTKICLTIR